MRQAQSRTFSSSGVSSGGSPTALPTRCQSASACEEPAEDKLEDAAVAQILALARRIEADARSEFLGVRADGDLCRVRVVDAEDGELLAPREAERLPALALPEPQGQAAPPP